MTEPYVLSAFTMSTVSHGNFGLWRHPQDRTADIAAHLIPELRRRGRAREPGGPTTLRQKLFGGDDRFLSEGHPGAGFRRNSVTSQ